MPKMEAATFTREEDPYAYYKITRIYDGFTSYCSTLNFIENYFERLHGVPDKWIESEEKAEIKVFKDQIQIPLWIKASVDGMEFNIILSKQEYTKVQLKINE